MKLYTETNFLKNSIVDHTSLKGAPPGVTYFYHFWLQKGPSNNIIKIGLKGINRI